jgi:hypothetical protein
MQRIPSGSNPVFASAQNDQIAFDPSSGMPEVASPSRHDDRGGSEPHNASYHYAQQMLVLLLRTVATVLPQRLFLLPVRSASALAAFRQPQ